MAISEHDIVRDSLGIEGLQADGALESRRSSPERPAQALSFTFWGSPKRLLPNFPLKRGPEPARLPV